MALTTEIVSGLLAMRIILTAVARVTKPKMKAPTSCSVA